MDAKVLSDIALRHPLATLKSMGIPRSGICVTVGVFWVPVNKGQIWWYAESKKGSQ